MENEIIKNQIYETVIDGYTSEALGVCRINGHAVFVPGTLAGEKCRIKILKTGACNYGKAEEILSVSENRVEPECPHYRKCGGCSTRHMSYQAELEFKLSKVNDALKHIGKQDFSVREIIASDRQDRYRNKAVYSVGQTKDGIVSGFYRERSHDIIDIPDCLLQTELSNRVVAAVREIMQILGLSAYDESTHKGTVRHVFVRQALKTDDAVACIISAAGFGKNTSLFVKLLLEKVPELTGIVLNINKTVGNSVLQGEFYTLWGKNTIIDEICGNRFEIAPQAFFQINPPQAEKLYNTAVEYAIKTPDDIVMDLYCGAGTITLSLARKASKVIGAEIVAPAIENAKNNAVLNGITNTEFICSDAAEAAKYLSDKGFRPDSIVVDPPRKGLSPEVISYIAGIGPERIVYVSCNPSTLARDILLFNEYGYCIKEGKAVDMFPRTSHVETVVLLSIINNLK